MSMKPTLGIEGAAAAENVGGLGCGFPANQILAFVQSCSGPQVGTTAQSHWARIRTLTKLASRKDRSETPRYIKIKQWPPTY